MTKFTLARGGHLMTLDLEHCPLYGSGQLSGADEATHPTCKEAVSHSEKTPVSRKGAVFSECLRIAKLIQKKLRLQARADKKKGKVAA